MPDLNPNEIYCKILTEFIGKSINLQYFLSNLSYQYMLYTNYLGNFPLLEML